MNPYFDRMVAIPASLALCTAAAGLAFLGRGYRLSGRRPWDGSRTCGWVVGFVACGFRSGCSLGCLSIVGGLWRAFAPISSSAPEGSIRESLAPRSTGSPRTWRTGGTALSRHSSWAPRSPPSSGYASAGTIQLATSRRALRLGGGRYDVDWCARGAVVRHRQQPQSDSCMVYVPLHCDRLRCHRSTCRRRGDRRGGTGRIGSSIVGNEAMIPGNPEAAERSS